MEAFVLSVRSWWFLMTRVYLDKRPNTIQISEWLLNLHKKVFFDFLSGDLD